MLLIILDLAIEKSHHTDDRVILLVDNQYNVYSYPDTDELVNYLKSNEKQIYFYLSSLSTGVITGFGMIFILPFSFFITILLLRLYFRLILFLSFRTLYISLI